MNEPMQCNLRNFLVTFIVDIDTRLESLFLSLPLSQFLVHNEIEK